MKTVGVDNPAAADLVDGPHPAARHTGLLVRAHVTHRLQLHGPLLHTDGVARRRIRLIESNTIVVI